MSQRAAVAEPVLLGRLASHLYIRRCCLWPNLLPALIGIQVGIGIRSRSGSSLSSGNSGPREGRQTLRSMEKSQAGPQCITTSAGSNNTTRLSHSSLDDLMSLGITELAEVIVATYLNLSLRVSHKINNLPRNIPFRTLHDQVEIYQISLTSIYSLQ